MSASSSELKNLSLDRLRNFAAVVRKGGIKAATGDDVSRQVLFSRQISELSSHFGVELTRRAGKGIQFTPAGVQLARLVTELESGLEDLRGSVRGAPVAYSIAASNSVLHWLVLPKLNVITDVLPGVKWTLRHESTAAIGEKVSMGQIDFGLCVGAPTVDTLKRCYLGYVEYSLFVPQALGDKADHAEILRELPLALPVGGTLRESLNSWAKKSGANLNVRLEVDSYLQAADFVIRGTHAAVLPTLAAASMPKGINSVPLPATVAQRRKLWLAWTNRLLSTRSAAESVRDALIRHFRL